LDKIPGDKFADKEKIINWALEKCPHPRQVKLEVERIIGANATENTENIDGDDVKVYFKSSEDMSEVPNESVALIVTSPPYWNKVEFQDVLSRAKTPDEFFQLMEPIIQESTRVLIPSGKFVLNWGEPIGKETGQDYQEEVYVNKWIELFKKHGLRLYAKIIWEKNVFYAASMNRVRYEDARRGDGKTHLNWEWVLVFRKPGSTREGDSQLSYDEWKEASKSVWHIPAAQSIKGLAVFPEELVKRVVKLYSFPGDTILDVFLGSGTTLAVAKALNRRGIGYEINRELRQIIKQKLDTINLSISTSKHVLTVTA
jgi:DNA modification methylase